MNRIGILNSGGDCAGLNAVIASAVKCGIPTGYSFIGFERGWEGLLDKTYIDLSLERVHGISHLGGTILRTANKGRFAGKVGSGNVNTIDPAILALAKRNAEELELEGLLVIGGDGGMSSAAQLAAYGLRLVGVPKTIDNDIASTDKTFGFSTAVQVAVDALDKIHTTASSQDRTFFVECMGRNAGWISLFAGLAGNANAILLPEFSFNIEEFIGFLRKRRNAGKMSAIIVVSEGLRVKKSLIHKSGVNSSEIVLGGASELLMHLVEEGAPGEFEMRNVVLGHTQRGGSPMSQDRILAKRYGIEAMLAFHRGESNVMVATRNNRMVTVPLNEAAKGIKKVAQDTYEYQAAEHLGIFVNGSHNNS